MLLMRFHPMVSRLVRLAGLALVVWTVVSASDHAPGTSGRGLVVTITLVLCVAAWLWWLRVVDADLPLSPDVYVLAGAGGVLVAASPDSAASTFVFVASVTAGLRVELARAWIVVALGTLALAVSALVWDGGALGLLAYALGFAASTLGASNVRQFRERAAQAELLLAQSQRSQEEQLRAARLEESTRIAREIHDLLAHALAGLTIQLEATTALIENGADSAQILARVRRAHELARDGLRETRRAVGALRGDGPSVPEAIETLAADHPARLTLTGDRARLHGDPGHAVLRVVQEALTNASKHAPGSEATIAIDAGSELVAIVENGVAAVPVVAGGLSDSGGGYGIEGMRERAAALHGTLSAGPTATGWRVELRIPSGSGGAGR